MSGEYDGCCMTSQSKFSNFCLVTKAVCGLALSWWKTTPFLFANSGRYSATARFKFSNWAQYILALIVWPRKQLEVQDTSPILPHTKHHFLWMQIRFGDRLRWLTRTAPRPLVSDVVVYNLFFSRDHSFEKRLQWVQLNEKIKVVWIIIRKKLMYQIKK